jgi:hypothetical protein
VSKRRLVVEVEDDGTTVSLHVFRFEVIGSSQVGPTCMLAEDVLSLPSASVDDWAKDHLVQIIERL